MGRNRQQKKLQIKSETVRNLSAVPADQLPAVGGGVGGVDSGRLCGGAAVVDGGYRTLHGRTGSKYCVSDAE